MPEMAQDGAIQQGHRMALGSVPMDVEMEWTLEMVPVKIPEGQVLARVISQVLARVISQVLVRAS